MSTTQNPCDADAMSATQITLVILAEMSIRQNTCDADANVSQVEHPCDTGEQDVNKKYELGRKLF